MARPKSARDRSFRVLMLILGGMLLGVGATAVARERLALEAATITSLDRAISDALAIASDSADVSDTRVRALVAERRDAQIRAKRLFNPWKFMQGAGVALVVWSGVIGVISLASFLVPRRFRADAQHG